MSQPSRASTAPVVLHALRHQAQAQGVCERHGVLDDRRGAVVAIHVGGEAPVELELVGG
jgi:hypothetical protein